MWYEAPFWSDSKQNSESMWQKTETNLFISVAVNATQYGRKRSEKTLKLNNRSTFQLPEKHNRHIKTLNKVEIRRGKTDNIQFSHVINQLCILCRSSGHGIFIVIALNRSNFFLSGIFFFSYLRCRINLRPFRETNNNKNVYKKIMVLIYKFHPKI